MGQSIDIHDFDERITKAERLVDTSNPLSALNAEFIKRFEAYCFSSGLSKARILKYVFFT
jgi:hypothetical protein